jgi:DNA-nicking Smr family endonuclease
MSSRKLTLDLHPIFGDGRAIDAALADAVDEAERRKLKELEIIHGKGSGQLKKRVLRYLDRKDVRERYHRVDKDPGNHGHVFVYFRWKRGQ